jgi:hypothetical protein
MLHPLLLSFLAFQLGAQRRDPVPEGRFARPVHPTSRLRRWRPRISRLVVDAAARTLGRHHPLHFGLLLLDQNFVKDAVEVLDGGLSGQPVRIRSAGRRPSIQGFFVSIVGDGTIRLVTAAIFFIDVLHL